MVFYLKRFWYVSLTFFRFFFFFTKLVEIFSLFLYNNNNNYYLFILLLFFTIVHVERQLHSNFVSNSNRRPSVVK